MEKKFNLDDKITVYPRTIRPSKFHTCMCTMHDRKVFSLGLVCNDGAVHEIAVSCEPCCVAFSGDGKSL